MALVLGAQLAATTLAQPASAGAGPESAEVPAGEVKVGGRLPVVHEPGVTQSNARAQGWLVLNSTTRRAYQFFENALIPAAQGGRETWVQSFDLDTLQPIRRARMAGFVPLKARGSNGGDLVHAVDAERGRLFLAMSAEGNPFVVGSTNGDGQRSFAHVRVIDERAFDEGRDDFFRDMTTPADQRALVAGHSLRGMTFTGGGGAGKLLLLFAAVDAFNVNGIALRPVFDHQLVQWGVDRPETDDWSAPTLLASACGRAPLTGATQSTSIFYQLGILATPKRIHLVCQPSAGVSHVARIHLAADGRPDLERAPDLFPLGRTYGDVLVDEAGERLYLRTVLAGTTWWVFDARSGSWAGAVGATIGDYGNATSAGIDPGTGRFYALVPHHIVERPSGLEPVDGGFRMTDGRLDPVPQLTDALPALAYPGYFRIQVDPAAEGRPRRVFVRRGASTATCFSGDPRVVGAPCDPSVYGFYDVIEDTVPVAKVPPLSESDRLTIDTDEAPGKTQANFGGAASGYGLRMLLTGGLSAATSRDLDGSNGVSHGSSCLPVDREVVFGTVESAEVSDSTAGAVAAAMTLDPGSRLDLEDPSARCWPTPTGNATIGEVLRNFPGDAPAEGGVGYEAGQTRSACSGEESEEAKQDTPVEDLDVKASCQQSKALVSASSRAAFGPGGAASPIKVLTSSTTATVRRDPAGGTMSRVVSEARGIEITGVGSIGTVRTTATSQAKGRPNTAEATFVRKICAIEVGALKIAGCATPAQQQQLVTALNQRLAGRAEARLRSPDSEYAAGTPGGYQSAIQRDRLQKFTDQVVSKDTSLGVPGLEIVFYRDHAFQGSGRQVFQFAGVQANSQYGIICLLGPGEKGGCADPPPVDPANLKISLADDSVPPNPLAGGLFKVHSDRDEDGVLGEADKLTDGGSCLTTADGVGNCEFKGLDPGSYVIEQIKAPAGYQAAEPFAVELIPGNTRTVQFTNLLAVGVISLRLTDDSSDRKPLKGGVFDVYADDGDEKKGSGDLRYASCTTDERGNCRMALEPGAESVAPPGEEPVLCLEASGICLLAVPLGPYVVHQSAPPDGYAAAEDVGFSLDQPGDLALLSFANGRKAVPGSGAPLEQPTEADAEPEAEPSATEATSATPGTPAVPPTESVVIELFAEAPKPIVSTTPTMAGGVVREVLRLPAKIIEKGVQGLKLLFSSPRELALMATVWLLVWAPCYLGERRRLAARLTTTTPGAPS